MARKSIVAMVLTVLVPLASCIVSDQITTFTIQPDGSADLVKFQSNIRSTEAGEKGAQELKQFVKEFDANQDADYLHITRSGGTVLEARWLRREEPYANVVVAKFPSSSALLEFCTIKGEKGETIARPNLTQDGKRRRLSIEVPVPKDQKQDDGSKQTIQQIRQEQASGISETRIAVSGGLIINSRGFTIATDKRSALLEPAEIRAQIEAKQEKVELFLEWELAGK